MLVSTTFKYIVGVVCPLDELDKISSNSLIEENYVVTGSHHLESKCDNTTFVNVKEWKNLDE